MYFWLVTEDPHLKTSSFRTPNEPHTSHVDPSAHASQNTPHGGANTLDHTLRAHNTPAAANPKVYFFWGRVKKCCQRGFSTIFAAAGGWVEVRPLRRYYERGQTSTCPAHGQQL